MLSHVVVQKIGRYGYLLAEFTFETKDEATAFIERNDEPGVEWLVVADE